MCVLYEICQFQRYKANTVFYACCSQSNLCKYDTVPPQPPPAHTYLTLQWLCIAFSIKSQIP